MGRSAEPVGFCSGADSEVDGLEGLEEEEEGSTMWLVSVYM
jgi:hypothetical protein